MTFWRVEGQSGGVLAHRGSGDMSGWWWRHKDNGLSNQIHKYEDINQGFGPTSTITLFLLIPKKTIRKRTKVKIKQH